MVTPFTSSNNIDFEATERLVEYLIAGGTNFIVALGTTGEASTLSEKERNDFVRFVVQKCSARVPVIVGIGGNDTGKVSETIRSSNLEGCSAILSVTPYYNKPTQNGLYQHFSTIAKVSKLPIIVYNVPGRTGVNMAAETTLRLAHDVPNIIGVKEASGNLNQMSYILRDKPEQFLVLSGDDGLLLPQLSIGADGVISVLGNALPKPFANMIDLAQHNRYNEAQKIHLSLVQIIDLLFAEGNPGGVKAALSVLGIINNYLRLPLVPVSSKLYDSIKTELAGLKA